MSAIKTKGNVCHVIKNYVLKEKLMTNENSKLPNKNELYKIFTITAYLK